MKDRVLSIDHHWLDSLNLQGSYSLYILVSVRIILESCLVMQKQAGKMFAIVDYIISMHANHGPFEDFFPPKCVIQFVTQMVISCAIVSKLTSEFQFKKYLSYDKHA